MLRENEWSYWYDERQAGKQLPKCIVEVVDFFTDFLKNINNSGMHYNAYDTDTEQLFISLVVYKVC